MKKYNTKVIFIFVLVLAFQRVFGQAPMYFSKAYCPGGIGAIATNVPLTDSGYIIAGAYKDSINNNQRLFLTSIDHNGLLKTVNTHGIDSMKFYPVSGGSVIQVKDSVYIWACQKSNIKKAMGTLISFDRSFNVNWEVDYPYNNDTVYSFLLLLNVKATADNGFIMTGASTSGHYVDDLLLQKTDSLGNIQWRKQFVYYGVTIGWSVIQTPDHGFLVGGGAYTPYVKHTYQGLIIKTDSLGNEQWRRYPGSPDYDDCYCIVRNSPDGNYIVGSQLGVEQFYNSPYALSKTRVTKYNTSGNVLWDKTYGPKKLWNMTTQLYIHPNGDIVTCGNYLPGDTLLNVDSYSWILKMNNVGDSIWMREHYLYNGSYCTNALQDVKPTPDGGYILVGKTDSFMYIPQSAWVLKVDSLGCAVPGCQYVGMKEVIIKNEELEMFPNPASEVVNLKLPAFINQQVLEIRIFNQLGQEVLRHAVAPETPLLTIPIHALPPGTYFVRAITRDMSVTTTKKLIISR